MMVDVSRRSFLGGAITVAAISIISKAEAIGLPIIYGDGLHDDTAGLQALLNREPVLIEREVVHAREGAITIPRGVFLISDTIKIERQSFLKMEGCTLIAAPSFPAEQPVIWLDGHCRDCQIIDVFFDARLVRDPGAAIRLEGVGGSEWPKRKTVRA